MSVRETPQQALLRWDALRLVQAHYADFIPFLEDVMEMLGFSTSEVQRDIAAFLVHGPQYLMIQAQRGQAKTTIAAAYVVWCLIHDPRTRALVLSAGGGQASDISILIIRIIMTMEVLECMRPDTNNGDRSSVEHFDVHYTLKGVDKSPSVKCLGITANMQGNRADILLADDIESAKNSATALQRAQLLQLTLDFTSICSTGRIIWLGTPQSSESIYNGLPGRGVTVRIWPGRFPTNEQREHYGEHLAPYVLRRLQMDPLLATGGGVLGDQGQPLDPTYLTEDVLVKKELDQGAAYFQLQHMLNTKLTDSQRYPLKLDQIVTIDSGLKAPLEVVRGFSPSTLRSFQAQGFGFKVQTPHELSREVAAYQGIVAYVDPAGGGMNADETACQTTGFLNGNVHWLAQAGLPGGYNAETMLLLAERIMAWPVNRVIIEKNMGFGAFREVFIPVLKKVCETAGKPMPAVDDDYVTGQKERRICATLEPVIGRGALIMNSAIVEQDAADCARYSMATRLQYSVFHQMAKMTRDTGAVLHDDRVDALEGSVRYWQQFIAINQSEAVKKQRAREHAESLKDPLGHTRYEEPKARRPSLLNRFRR